MIDLLGKAMLSTPHLARGFDLYESLLSLPVLTPRKVYAVLIYLSVPFFRRLTLRPIRPKPSLALFSVAVLSYF